MCVYALLYLLLPNVALPQDHACSLSSVLTQECQILSEDFPVINSYVVKTSLS